jgi:hypothetical protein
MRRGLESTQNRSAKLLLARQFLKRARLDWDFYNKGRLIYAKSRNLETR